MSKSKPLPKQAPPARPPGKGKGAPPADTMPPERAKAYWRKNLTIIAILLSIWAIVSYGIVILGANLFFGIPVGQIPMSFWFAQQGAIVIFVILIFVYCWYMDRVDKEFGVNE